MGFAQDDSVARGAVLEPFSGQNFVNPSEAYLLGLDLKLYCCLSCVLDAELFGADFGGVGAGGEADFSGELAVEVEG
jgi:hypothetical protein